MWNTWSTVNTVIKSLSNIYVDIKFIILHSICFLSFYCFLWFYFNGWNEPLQFCCLLVRTPLEKKVVVFLSQWDFPGQLKVKQIKKLKKNKNPHVTSWWYHWPVLQNSATASRLELSAKSVPASAGEPTEPAGSTAPEKTLIVELSQVDLWMWWKYNTFCISNALTLRHSIKCWATQHNRKRSS